MRSALFFLAYALTMAGTAGLRSAPQAHRAPHRAFAAAFLGNALAVRAAGGLIEGGWPYAIAASA
ncbi:MAG: hypothetical protein ACLSVD_03090 [Eggerthellaceae bacterium]